MNIQTIFFICLIVAIIGFITAIINMFTAPKRFFSEGVTGIIGVHIVAGAMYGLGGIGMIVSGIIWIVTYLKH